MTFNDKALAVRLEGCAKTFPDGTKALQPLDLSIGAGETLAFLGPSGCGKTTLLRLIAGLDIPDPGGRVWFDDQDVTAAPIERRKVGMVFQSYALFPNMTVAENVGYGLKIAGMPRERRRKRVDELLAMMRIEALAGRSIDQLSGGQRQRVALARAIAPRPRLLLFDEPLTALDAKLRETLRVEINGLLRQLGTTAVYVTHDQAEAMALGERIVVMSHGRIAQIGTPHQIYHQPSDLFVAEFVGLMNRVDGEWKDGWLHCAGGRIPAGANGVPGSDGPGNALFRPEHARLTQTERAHVRGTLSAAFFLGDRTRLLIDGIGAGPVTVDLMGPVDLAVGATVPLEILSLTSTSSPRETGVMPS
ncbi:ABC transporter ATP-binding protein [Telmatospirillum siberiense]|uniref:ABC transporter ATP-binding protein n=1 Tax=Telmatospirillum siberiense TaxID=382514 RepID=A0A2N3PX54_9PROT|nr:ABC transporter ATP-binding protein [Telmatospirillum siberiense]PKU24977.1 ABC transporter ATP-binding protein [Telmatospirillum siberiense]